MARQTSVTPSSSRPGAAAIEFTQQWTNALTSTLQKGIETFKQSQRDQQRLPVLNSKAGNRAHSLSNYMGALGGTGCCHTLGQAVLTPDVDEQHLTRAERLSLLTVQAHEYTLQYRQVSTGCLMELADLKCKCNLL